MRRREFIGGMLAALSAHNGARAQSDRIQRIGWLDLNSTGANLGVFEQAMTARGWAREKSYALEYRGGDGRIERLAAVTADLIRLPVDVIVAPGLAEATTARRATKSVPIVMAGIVDPVGHGLVASLARPGRNVTGVAGGGRELTARLLSSVRDIVPGTTRVAVMWVGTEPDHRAFVGDLRSAAHASKVAVNAVEVVEYTDVEPAFAAIKRQGNKALLVPATTMLVPRWIADLALAHGLPLAATGSAYAYEGGLLACTDDWNAIVDRVASIVDKVLKGARAADVPVELPPKFRLIVNARTAHALKLAVPPSLLARADTVIE